MDSVPPKRRKISPDADAASQNQSTTPKNSPPPNKSAENEDPNRRRPSFASPTRATLSRYNPEILARRQSQESPRRSTEKETESTRTDDAQGAARGAREGSLLKSPARRRGISVSRTPTRLTPRPLPPPGPEEEEILNPFQGRVLHRSPATGVLPAVVVPEPELPPTPELPDPVVSTPPSGIHNTPSKRPRRSKALAETLKSSSPLKQPPLQSTHAPSKPTKLAQKPRRKTIQTSEPDHSVTTDELRGLPPTDDPDAEQKKLRDSLLAEVAQLERDLEVAAKENERIRQAHLSKRAPSLPSNREEIIHVLRRHALPPGEGDEDAKNDGRESDPAATSAWLRAALNPIAFLPFSKPGSEFPALPSSLAKESDKGAEEPAPASHHPVQMTAEEALPYLQVFTPLTFTSHISPLPREEAQGEGDEGSASKAPLLQRHTITATSSASNPLTRGLFTSRIEMDVNTKTMAIENLRVPFLEPASTAELTPFITSITAAKGSTSVPSSALMNNVNVLCWGMGEWVRVATQRARAWCTLDREVGGGSKLDELVSRTMQRAALRKRKRRRRKEREAADDGGSDSSGSEGDDDHNDDINGGFTAEDLLPYMGQTSFDVEVRSLKGAGTDEDNVSTLRVLWRIEFDWTGEAASDVGVLVGVPGKCKFQEPSYSFTLAARFC